MREIVKSNRRLHQRIRLSPMYTNVLVELKPAGHDRKTPPPNSLLGHAYDLSETGVRIELDHPLSIGDSVSMELGLPGSESHVHVIANVIWVNDHEDDPGPRRMALQFKAFSTPADRLRLQNFLGNDAQRAAA